MKYKIKFLIVILVVLCNINVHAANANSCDGTATFTRENNESNDDKNIVNIKCTKEDASATFKPGNLNLIVGQGFDYRISLKYTSKCEGSFNVNKWKKNYDDINKKLLSAKNEDKEWYENQKLELEKILNNYASTINAYDKNMIDVNNMPNAILSLNYKFQNVNKLKHFSFVVDSQKNNIDFKKVGKSEKILNKNIVNYNVTITSEMELLPSRVYINTLGEILDANSNNTLDGGNKFYTELKSDVGTYNMTITINNIGNNHNIELKNEMCQLTLRNASYSYRIIDVNNPFVNAKKLDDTINNWKNRVYNFVEITKINQNNKGYTFMLSKSDIDAIKNDNTLSSNAYLGICNNSNIKQYGVMAKVCEIINNN